MGNYEKKPFVKVNSDIAIKNNKSDIINELLKQNKKNIIIECYPGVDINKLEENIINELEGYEKIYIDDYAKTPFEIQNKIKQNITEDRVFGFMSHYEIEEFYDLEKINKLKKEIVNKQVVVYGFGASLLFFKDSLLVYANITRWEIQLRYRAGLENWKADNKEEDPIRKFKRGYFFEWRVADRLKKRTMKNMNYMLDATDNDKFKLITNEQYFKGLAQVVKQPFRLVPFFDSGVWGGQWMKEKFNLDPNEKNYAWSFDGVVEENSILLKYANDLIEIPAIDVVFFKTKKLLGDNVHARFGDEFPIRFDFLDTMNGQNLSLQVHPVTEYIQEKFGMNYTQDESYYILDAKEDEDTFVYLGFKEGVDKGKFKQALQKGQAGEEFDAEKYINKILCKKHDHFLIPAGTIHCSGKNTVVLEISATPYIFTFKLWDWARLGLDGKPRPIHIDHGMEVLDFERDTNFVYNELVNQFKYISDSEEKTGLHKREFIETRRFLTDQKINHQTLDTVHVLNLVKGEAAIISSPTQAFEDYEVHYAETFIIPANITDYEITPKDNKEIAYIKAYVRGNNEA